MMRRSSDSLITRQTQKCKRRNARPPHTSINYHTMAPPNTIHSILATTHTAHKLRTAFDSNREAEQGRQNDEKNMHSAATEFHAKSEMTPPRRTQHLEQKVHENNQSNKAEEDQHRR